MPCEDVIGAKALSERQKSSELQKMKDNKYDQAHNACGNGRQADRSVDWAVHIGKTKVE